MPVPVPVMKTRTVMVIVMPVWMLSLYSAFSAQGRTWRCQRVGCPVATPIAPLFQCAKCGACCCPPHPRGLPPNGLAAVHSALRGIAGSAAKKLPPVTRTGVHTDNPLRCTAVEHAVKLIVEGQVASMATSCDKRIATTH